MLSKTVLNIGQASAAFRIPALAMELVGRAEETGPPVVPPRNKPLDIRKSVASRTPVIGPVGTAIER